MIYKKNNFFKINREILNEYNEIKKLKKYRITNSMSSLKFTKDIKKYKNIYNLFLKIEKIIKKKKKNVIFEDIWLVKSNKRFTNLDKVPYVPHIDKIRKYKVMVYLNDIGINCGPLYISKISPEKFEEKRKKFSKNYQKNKENIINIPKEKFIPCIGPFGTTIFFDTNSPHFGGRIMKINKERLILRFNFRYVDKFTKNINHILKRFKISNKAYFLNN
jgi:hypothetical protein